MKGNTTIKFNQATMIEAVQMYIDAQLTGKHSVASVKATSGGGYDSQNGFEIEISEADKETKAA
jgi:hypothetical protein